MSGICEKCHEFTMTLDWCGHAELCPECKANEFGEGGAADGDVRGECDECGCFTSDLRARDGRTLCGPCDTFSGFRMPRRSLPQDRFALGFLCGVALATLVAALSYFTR